MKSGRRFLDADVICLNETWLWPDQNTSHLKIDGFQFHHPAKRRITIKTKTQSWLRNSK